MAMKSKGRRYVSGFGSFAAHEGTRVPTPDKKEVIFKLGSVSRANCADFLVTESLSSFFTICHSIHNRL